MAWYKTGTISVTNASATVAGSGTAFVANVQAGDVFHGPDERQYEILSINSDTQLTLASNYLGSSQSGQAYRIQPTRGVVSSLLSSVNSLIASFQSIANGAGAGKFGLGSAAAPSISFTDDQDTGLFRKAANVLGFGAAGAERASLSASAFNMLVPITGTPLQSSASDTTAGKLLTPGAFGLGRTTAIQNTDWDNIAVSGFYTNGATSSDLVGGPGSYTNMSLLHMQGGGVNEATQMASRNSASANEAYFRSKSGGVWSAWSQNLVPEVGTWTPALKFGGATTGIVYTGRPASYEKIGRLVIARGRITLSSKGSATGAASISGLPYAIASGSEYMPGSAYLVSGFTGLTGAAACRVTTGTELTLGQGGATGNTLLTDAVFTDAANFGFVVAYHT